MNTDNKNTMLALACVGGFLVIAFFAWAAIRTPTYARNKTPDAGASSHPIASASSSAPSAPRIEAPWVKKLKDALTGKPAREEKKPASAMQVYVIDGKDVAVTRSKQGIDDITLSLRDFSIDAFPSMTLLSKSEKASFYSIDAGSFSGHVLWVNFASMGIYAKTSICTDENLDFFSKPIALWCRHPSK
jgi:hypothetical protein